jgi:uncharacterized protein (DUF2141 family)
MPNAVPQCAPRFYLSTVLVLGTAAALAAPAFAPAFAQVQSTNGSIQGDVMDAKGGVIPGATIEADEVDTGTVHPAVTDGSGHFDFLSLKPGGYVVKVSKSGFATTIQQNITLTVGRTQSLKITLQIASGNESITITSAPIIDVVTDSSTTTLNDATIATTPVLGRKFEDLLTLTPGVSIVQGPDGDEININGQRGIFNNISLDGGDYNNGFFGEQSGGQRAAVDITLEAVKEFQIVASGANAEFGRTGGGVVNVITKSGTNGFHGSLFEYQRLKALAADASDGTPLTNFHREQFGGSAGGAIIKDKLFYFGAGEGIDENLSRTNLSAYNATALGSAACPTATPAFGTPALDAAIDSNGDCQRLALLSFFKSNFNENDGAPVDHVVHNAAFFGRGDYNINQKNLLYASYNFDYSRNPNQTFDVATYGTTANGVEGAAHIQTFNTNLITTLNDRMLNEAHVTYGHETRPRAPIDPNAVPDTGIGFAPSFRFGQPFFLGPGASETFYHYDLKDNFSLIVGKHSLKMGGEFLYSHNVQVFDGFALGRFIFSDAAGFLHYASPASTGNGYGPATVGCSDGSYASLPSPENPNGGPACPAGTTSTGSPLLLYLQDAATQAGETVQQAGASSIANKEPALYIQDTWAATSRLTLNYGLRWEAQFFPKMAIAPSAALYGPYLSDPAFPSTGYLPNQTKEFQPRFGFAYNVLGDGKTLVRGSAGIFNARQNMLTEVGAITTNGVQQQSQTQFSLGPNPDFPITTDPTYKLKPNSLASCPTTGCPGAGVTVFDKNYHNPRILAFNVGLERQLGADYVAFVDFTDSKGVRLTRFVDPNVGAAVLPGQVIPGTNGNVYSANADTVCYVSGSTDTCPGLFAPGPFANLGAITDTISNAKSLYRGVTLGLRKRMSNHFQFQAQYTYSVDRDDDSNERDPFTFRYANLYNLRAEYSLSDRDERHKFNAFGLGDLPFGIKGNVRIQAHSAEPYTNETRFVNGVDLGRNTLRKDNAFFVTDFGLARPFHFHDSKFTLEPRAEVFNAFNNKNNLNPLSSPALFDFSGFLRTGVGDPIQSQLSLRFIF